MKRRRSLLFIILLVIVVLILPAFAAAKTVQLKKAPSAGSAASACDMTVETAPKLQPLEVHFINVGQGDCTLIRSGDEAMLIDAGSASKGTAVQLYLQKQGISSLKYVIATHPDEDHIGGMPVIISKFNIGKYFAPDVSNDTRAYDNIIQALKYKGITPETPKTGSSYALGSAEFTVVSTGKQYGSLNNCSICIRLVNGENSFLFVGDAEKDAENDMIKGNQTLKSDVYKTGHHGSNSSSISGFVNAVNPQYAVISCGNNNDYGHPQKKLLDRLRSNGVKVFRTDEQGHVIAISDGVNITWNMLPSTSWNPGKEAEVAPTVTPAPEPTSIPTPAFDPADEAYYVLNTNSNVFHIPTCVFADRMSERNKKISYESFSQIKAMGYKPCGNCLKDAA